MFYTLRKLNLVHAFSDVGEIEGSYCVGLILCSLLVVVLFCTSVRTPDGICTEWSLASLDCMFLEISSCQSILYGSITLEIFNFSTCTKVTRAVFKRFQVSTRKFLSKIRFFVNISKTSKNNPKKGNSYSC